MLGDRLGNISLQGGPVGSESDWDDNGRCRGEESRRALMGNLGPLYEWERGGGRRERALALEDAGGALAQMHSCYWLEEGTTVYLVMATTTFLISLLKAAEMLSKAVGF